MLTNAGLMNVRFCTHESEDDADAMIRFPGQAWNPHNIPSNLGALSWGGGAPDESDKDKPLVAPPSSAEQSETEYISQGGLEEDPDAVLISRCRISMHHSVLHPSREPNPRLCL